MDETPKFSHSSMTPQERAKMDNMEAQEALNADSDPYAALVNKLIRQRYSPSHECAILRKKLAGIDQGTAFEEWNAYAEECKQKAKEILDNSNISGDESI